MKTKKQFYNKEAKMQSITSFKGSHSIYGIYKLRRKKAKGSFGSKNR